MSANAKQIMRTFGQELLAGTIEFRKATAMQKDFEFIEDSRVDKKTWARAIADAGEFMTKIQNFNLLGDGIPDEASRMAAREQTDCYLE